MKRQVDQGLVGENVVLQKQSLGASRVIVDSNLGGRVAGSSGESASRLSVAMASVKVASSSFSYAGTGSNTSSTAVTETSAPQWIQPIDTRFFSYASSLSFSNNNKDQGEFLKVELEYWPGSMNNSTTNDPNDDGYIQFSLNNQRQPPLLSHAHFQQHQLPSSNPPSSSFNPPLSPSNTNNDWYKDAKSFPSTSVIPQEPMSIVLSLGLLQDELLLDPELAFPTVMKIDYIRLYQPRQNVNGNGKKDWLSCDPVGRPTAAYIREHSRAYSDLRVGTWAEAGYAYKEVKE
ncbi:hypothetical protein BGW39_001469, partial [Mortierella sp. 14UC]